MLFLLFYLPSEKNEHISFFLLYTINIAKISVKYRFRAYRLALLEAGAMTQQADLIAQQLGLHNKLTSALKDSEILKFCYLDRRSYILAIGQAFGK